ncbi:MAG: TRAP transporter small permease subunit [Saprospiraceae bacterium]
MDKVVQFISKTITLVGEKSALLNLVLIGLICFDVLQRYIFNQTFNWAIELEWHIFGLIFLLGSAYTLQEDKHVRVDLFYQDFAPKTKAWIDLLGSLLLLIPWCLLGIVTCYSYASNSFYINEGSPNPGGLPALYIIKYFVVVGFVLLLTQGCVMIYKNYKTISQ